MANTKFFIKHFICPDTSRILFYEKIRVGEDGKAVCIEVGFPEKVTPASLEDDFKKLEAECLKEL